jgi:hypothetical protein
LQFYTALQICSDIFQLPPQKTKQKKIPRVKFNKGSETSAMKIICHRRKKLKKTSEDGKISHAHGSAELIL